MLSARGVKVEEGAVPASNESTIYLPSCMKRYITREELLLIRFFFSHEQGHIEFTDFEDSSRLLRNGDLNTPLGLKQTVLNALEDIRIEHAMMRKYGGVEYIYDFGRTLARDVWDSQSPPSDPGGKMLREIVQLIYGGHYFNEYRETTSRLRGVLAPFFDEIDESIPEMGSTGELQSLFQRIMDALCDELSIEDRRSVQQTYAPSLPQAGAGSLKVTGEAIAGGEETVSPSKIATELQTAGRSEFGGYMNPRCHDDGRDAYNYGVKNASSAGRLLERFRGLDAGGYTKPLTTGTKIVQRKIAEFLKGQTLNILKRRYKHIHRSLAVVICVDDSGSMEEHQNDTMLYKPAWQATAMLAIACERANVAIQINRFCTQSTPVKDFLDSVASVKPSLTLKQKGGTRIAPSITLSRMQLRNRREENRVILLMTDGMVEEKRDVSEEIETCTREGVSVIPILFSNIAKKYPEYEDVWKLHDPIWIDDKDLDTPEFGRKLIARLCAWV